MIRGGVRRAAATAAILGGDAALATARAHGFEPGGENPAGAVWFVLTLALLLTAAILYARGLRRLWNRAGGGAGIPRWRALAFLTGWSATALALVSPLDALGEALFSAHMVQHEILMLLSAPCLVLGRPAVVALWAFPRGVRRRIGRAFAGSGWRALWCRLTHPLTAWSVYALVLWGWHIPALFEASILHDGMHAAQHFSFLGGALLFWWMCLEAPRARVNDGVAVLAIFTTALHASILGALLTFSPVVWYGPYLDTAPAFGLTPLEDQQLGGLIMWVPGGVAHLVAGLAVAARLLRDAGARARPVPVRGGRP